MRQITDTPVLGTLSLREKLPCTRNFDFERKNSCTVDFEFAPKTFLCWRLWVFLMISEEILLRGNSEWKRISKAASHFTAFSLVLNTHNSKFSFWQKNGNKSTELYYYEWYFRWIHEFQIKQFTIRNDFDDFSVFFWCTCGPKHYISSTEKWIPWYLSKRLRFSRRVYWKIVIKCLNKKYVFYTVKECHIWTNRSYIAKFDYNAISSRFLIFCMDALEINNGMVLFSLLGPKLDFFNILQNTKCVFYRRVGLTAKIVNKKVISKTTSHF